MVTVTLLRAVASTDTSGREDPRDQMNFLRRFLRRDVPHAAANQAIVMVMLGDTAPLSATAVLAYLTAHWSDLPSVAGYETEDAVTSASVPGGSLGFVHIPMPIPAGDLSGPVALAWHWPAAAAVVPAHRSHVIVHVRSTTLDTIDVRLLLTKLAASILAVSEGSGVYVGDAMLVRSAADYLEDAVRSSREELPILSWVGFNPVQEEGALSAYTTGLTAFGLQELEVRQSARPAAELFGTLADIAHYQLSSGRVLRDGDTFGASEFDRTQVRYGPSAFISGAMVTTLQLS
jgi:hypothetical protein